MCHRLLKMLGGVRSPCAYQTGLLGRLPATSGRNLLALTTDGCHCRRPAWPLKGIVVTEGCHWPLTLMLSGKPQAGRHWQ